MTRFKLVFSEAVRSIGANLSTTIAATMTVLIGMFLLGLFDRARHAGSSRWSATTSEGEAAR